MAVAGSSSVAIVNLAEGDSHGHSHSALDGVALHHHQHVYHQHPAEDDEKPKVLPEGALMRQIRIVLQRTGWIAMNFVTLSVSLGLTVAVMLFVVFSAYNLWTQHSSKILSPSAS